jgi:hypothetical protein
MKILVTRTTKTEHSTTGRMEKLNGQPLFLCYTLEPVTLPAGSTVKPRAIPCGIFPLQIRWSPDHGRYLPYVANVPGFTGIEIHVGNFPRDTKACCVVGMTLAVDAVYQSHVAFDKLFTLLLDGRTLPENDISAVLDCGTIEYREEILQEAA